MDGFSLETVGANTYLVYRIAEQDVLDSMSLGMLTHNNINGFASTTFTQVNAEQYIKYNISSKISVKQLFEGAVNKRRLLGVLSGILEAMLAAEDYMIDVKSLILDTEYIFTDVTSCKTIVLCLPIETGHQNDVSLFFKNLIFNLQFDRTENCDHVTELINYLNANPILSPYDFKELLDKLASKKTAPQGLPKQIVKEDKNISIIPEKKPDYVPTSRPTPVAEKTVYASSTPPCVSESEGNSGLQSEKSSKKMSAFYLLRHYSKENLAEYKAQKGSKQTSQSCQEDTNKKRKTGKRSNQVKTTDVDFVVPGQKLDSGSLRESTPIPAVQQQTYTDTPVNEHSPTIEQQSGGNNSAVETVRYMSGDFGGTQVLNAGKTYIPPTDLLKKKQPDIMHQFIIVRKKNGERITVNKPTFRLGRDPSYADYFISDNDAVGRSHAELHSKDGEYYIVDNNSTNHTFVNGKQISSGQEYSLADGDVFDLGDESFTVVIR